jgi:uncharacterized membrane protein
VATGNERHRAVAQRCVMAGLLLLLAASTAAVYVTWSGTLSVLLALVLIPPPLLPLGGIARHDRRTYAWATLCVLPAFLYGLTEAVANPKLRPVATTVLGASLVFFFALVAYLRVTRPRPGDQVSRTP